jgi:hypothetical protein
MASAAPITVSFGNYPGLGLGVGTTQTLTNIDATQQFEMLSLSGKYEITAAPNNELNLKDFSDNNVPRSVRFVRQDGGAFDVLGVTLRSGFGNILYTSDKGGSLDSSPLGPPPSFSGSEWQGVTAFTLTASQLFGESKFTSFSFGIPPTQPASVPEQMSLALLGLGLAGLGLAGTRRAA